MTPKVVSSDSVLQFVATDIMWRNPILLDNQPKGYHEFDSDPKSYHAIVAWHVLDPWFSNPNNSKHFIFENYIWWHEKAMVVPDVSFEELNNKSFLHQEYQDAMYNGHVGLTKTWKRLQINLWWYEMQGSIKSYIKSCEICQCNKTHALKLIDLLRPLEIPEWFDTWLTWSVHCISL